MAEDGLVSFKFIEQSDDFSTDKAIMEATQSLFSEVQLGGRTREKTVETEVKDLGAGQFEPDEFMFHESFDLIM